MLTAAEAVVVVASWQADLAMLLGTVAALEAASLPSINRFQASDELIKEKQSCVALELAGYWREFELVVESARE